LDVSEFDYRTAGGVRLEGRGIKPDESISATRNDIYSRAATRARCRAKRFERQVTVA
jgi:C-terminal processing protease CtpA/Prc